MKVMSKALSLRVSYWQGKLSGISGTNKTHVDILEMIVKRAKHYLLRPVDFDFLWQKYARHTGEEKNLFVLLKCMQEAVDSEIVNDHDFERLAEIIINSVYDNVALADLKVAGVALTRPLLNVDSDALDMVISSATHVAQYLCHSLKEDPSNTLIMSHLGAVNSTVDFLSKKKQVLLDHVKVDAAGEGSDRRECAGDDMGDGDVNGCSDADSDGDVLEEMSKGSFSFRIYIFMMSLSPLNVITTFTG
jgi:hypothetical protein